MEEQSGDQLPLSALLSQTLVAFTIELDNEAEHRLPHRTTVQGSAVPGGPWLTSVAMYFTCVKYVPEGGITVQELGRQARTPTNLPGMLRWRYITIEPKPAKNHRSQIKADAVIRLTPNGQRAKAIWEPLLAEIEERWRQRFGRDQIEILRQSLEAVTDRVGLDLPDFLPILGYGLLSKGIFSKTDGALSKASLPTLLSQVLLIYAEQYESRSEISLAISANVLRLIDEEGVRLKDLPKRSGVSKEAIAMAAGYLARHGFAVSQGGSLQLTEEGLQARGQYLKLTSAIDKRWPEHFGDETTRQLRASLIQLVGDGGPGSPLFEGLTPYAEGWRAKITKPSILPHYPMVLHRGGYPDGS